MWSNFRCVYIFCIRGKHKKRLEEIQKVETDYTFDRIKIHKDSRFERPKSLKILKCLNISNML